MIILVILVGLIFGSFLSSLTWRLAKGINIFDLKSRSICSKCKENIVWYDNIPLFSYAFLRGKCRNCHKKISLRYPLVEFSTAVLFLIFYVLAIPYYLVPSALLLLAIFVIDLEHQIIPDGLSFIIMLLGVIYLIFISPQLFYINILCGLSVSLFLLLTHLITKGKGMGLGDVKLALAIGVVLGWPGTIIWMYLSFLTGALVGIILILLGKAKFRVPIPFGPFLVISFLLALIYEKIF